MARIVSTVLLAACIGLFVCPPAGAAARYDVSYIWHGGLHSVFAYKQKVSRVLGPKVARNLKVVKKPGLYGLIYHRRGDSRGSTFKRG